MLTNRECELFALNLAHGYTFNMFMLRWER